MKLKKLTLKNGIALLAVLLTTSLLAQDAVPGTALSFDGTDNYIQCGNNGIIGISNAMTIEAWIKVSSTFPAAGRVGNIIGNVGNSPPTFNFEGHQNGRLRFYWNNGEINMPSILICGMIPGIMWQ